MSAHTPGPWNVDSRYHVHAIVDASGNDLTYQQVAPQFHDGEPCGSVTSRGRTAVELEANARLIAAAPELLAALEGVVSRCEPSGYVGIDGQFLKAVRAAIAKANGDST